MTSSINDSLSEVRLGKWKWLLIEVVCMMGGANCCAWSHFCTTKVGSRGCPGRNTIPGRCRGGRARAGSESKVVNKKKWWLSAFNQLEYFSLWFCLPAFKKSSSLYLKSCCFKALSAFDNDLIWSLSICLKHRTFQHLRLNFTGCVCISK